MMGNYYGDMFGWGFGGGIMMILFWIAITFLIVWFVRASRDGNYSDEPRAKSAMDILEKRYAKGEIDRKEFEEKKKDLAE